MVTGDSRINAAKDGPPGLSPGPSPPPPARSNPGNLPAMKGVLLAAGKGTRLYPVTRVIPKPLLPLANRTTLAYAFDALREIGVDEIALVVGENERAMREALGEGAEHRVRLTYVRQSEPKGLAHAVGFAREFAGDDAFCLYLGDAIYSASLAPFRETFERSGCDNLNLVQAVPDPERFGVAEVEGERIVRLVEKPREPRSNLAMAGVYFFGPRIWSAMEGLAPSGRGEYEITDAISRLIASGGDVRAGVYEGKWFDTGTLDSFLATNAWMLGGESRVHPSARVSGVVGPNVAIGEGALVRCARIEDSVILPGAEVEVDGEIRRAVLGGEVGFAGDLHDAIRHGTATS